MDNLYKTMLWIDELFGGLMRMYNEDEEVKREEVCVKIQKIVCGWL